MKTAIITGASSGVGTEFLKALVQDNSIEEFWIIARNEKRLEELKAQYSNKSIVCIPLDLTDEKSMQVYENHLRAKKPEVVTLVNNAGFGILGEVYGSDYVEQAKMVDLNCRALTTITTITLPYMTENSGIINMASIAAYCPNPNFTVYCSAKAYVLSYSRSLRYELRMKKRKINSLAVCPGPMNTNFCATAGITTQFDALPFTDPAKVAKTAVKKLREGKAVYTPGAFFKFYRCIAKLLPHSLVMGFSQTIKE